VRESAAGLGVQVSSAVRENASASTALGAAAAAAAGAAPADPLQPTCPRPLGPLCSAVQAALRMQGHLEAKDILRAAGFSLSAGSWVKLRAVLVVFFPRDHHRVQGTDLGPPRTSGALGVEKWLCKQQLLVLVADGWAAATLLSHVARSLCSDSSLRERHGARLLRDVSGL
jgi:hypothetical protein